VLITGGYNRTINRTQDGLTFRHVPALSLQASGPDQHLTNVLTKKKVKHTRVGYNVFFFIVVGIFM
jgi:hypothetical protein